RWSRRRRRCSWPRAYRDDRAGPAQDEEPPPRSLPAEELLHLRRELARIEVGQVRLTALLGAAAERRAACSLAALRGALGGLGLLARGLGGVLRLGLLALGALRGLP